MSADLLTLHPGLLGLMLHLLTLLLDYPGEGVGLLLHLLTLLLDYLVDVASADPSPGLLGIC